MHCYTDAPPSIKIFLTSLLPLLPDILSRVFCFLLVNYLFLLLRLMPASSKDPLRMRGSAVLLFK